MILKVLASISAAMAVSNNLVDIDRRGNNDYNGPLYIGAEYTETHLVYDTMSDWTVIVQQGVEDEVPSDYSKSDTAKPIYVDSDETSQAQVQVDLGSIFFTGREYTE